MAKIVAVIPVYNEQKTIKKVIDQVSKYVDKIIVVDDGSTDNSAYLAKGRKVILLQHIFNLGHGAAIQTGLDYAKKIDADIAVTFDADGQHKASEIPSMTKPIMQKTVDVTLGSRFKGRQINMPKHRWLTLQIGRIFTWFSSGILLTDTYNGFRALDRSALKKISLKNNGVSYCSELIDQLARNNISYMEVPVSVRYSEHTLKKGIKSIQAFPIMADYLFKKIS